MTDTKAPAAYPDPQDPGRTTIYEPTAQTDGERPTTPSERMAEDLEEEK